MLLDDRYYDSLLIRGVLYIPIPDFLCDHSLKATYCFSTQKSGLD